MLKNISPILSPELLKILCEMGHGDELVLGDGNFPHASMATNHLIRLDGHGCDEILDALLTLFPLDSESADVVSVMATDDGSNPPIWAEYQRTIEKHESPILFTKVERFAFYERSQKAYCIIATSEPKLYANLILKKGCVVNE